MHVCSRAVTGGLLVIKITKGKLDPVTLDLGTG